jgi:hypothetical protein
MEHSEEPYVDVDDHIYSWRRLVECDSYVGVVVLVVERMSLACMIRCFRAAI